MPSYLQASLVAGMVAAATVTCSSQGYGASTAAGANPRGQVLSLSCAGCHGTDGKSASIIPSINGKSAEYIESALKDFKSGARVSTVMARHAKGYSDEEIHLIAEYFGSVGKKTGKTGGRK